MNNPSPLELKFDPDKSINPEGKHVRDGLSTVLRTGDYLWMSCDERTSLERLKKIDTHTYAEHEHFDLTEYLDLPDGKNSEIDIEGLAETSKYLWLVGSHSLKRKKPRSADSMEKQIKRLAKVEGDPNRYLLARIPLVQNHETGEYMLYKECSDPDPDAVGKPLRAAQLKGDAKTNQFMDALAHDAHLKDFLRIPGKDNGFDIEGLSVHEEGRVFLGLRGPVLRGWAMILELKLEETEDAGELTLAAVNKKGDLYKKHFLHLEGMGVRELRVLGQDLYILAGPSMDLDGTIAVYRWRNAMIQTLEGEQIIHRKDLDRLFDVPHGFGPTSGKDKAEGLAVYDENSLIIVFDSPADDRKLGDNGVIADIYPLT